MLEHIRGSGFVSCHFELKTIININKIKNLILVINITNRYNDESIVILIVGLDIQRYVQQ